MDKHNAVGAALGVEVKRLGFSPIRLVKATGATRQTVYNWINGKGVAPYYRATVVKIHDLMADSDTAENAWRKICKHLNLVT